ncbi:MAG: hypothetical protein U1F21_14960 [Sphaerotilus natans]
MRAGACLTRLARLAGRLARGGLALRGSATARLALLLLRFLGAALLVQRAAAVELLLRDRAVLVADVAGGLAVEVGAAGSLGQRDQIGGGIGVAAQEGRQRRAAEHARRTLLDVGLDAQLQRPGRAVEQRRKALAQPAGAFGRAHVRSLGRARCGRGLLDCRFGGDLGCGVRGRTGDGGCLDRRGGLGSRSGGGDLGVGRDLGGGHGSG